MTAPRLILASASPRRRGLLGALGLPVAEVCPAHIPEHPRPGEDPVAYAGRLADEKAAAVVAMGTVDTTAAVVLAADTVVHMDGQLFEKPADAAEARRFLTALAGGWHAVSTGWRLLPGADVPGAACGGVVTAEVRFRALSPGAIASYVAAGESLDKAGAYGIQGLGAALVAEVRGSYSTVVGLPMDPVLDALARFHIHPVHP